MTPITTFADRAPAAQDCQVIELRQYRLHAGRRETLVELFDREFVDSQEAVGLRVIGQFRDLGDANCFAWLRGFADMQARLRGLQAFYGGPVWAAQRAAANATMVDSDDVLLLRPAWAGAGLEVAAGDRAPQGSSATPAGVVDATVLALHGAAPADLLQQCRLALAERLRAAGALRQGWYVTEPALNDFPRLPVREGEQVLVGITLFADAGALGRLEASRPWARQCEALLSPWLAGPPQSRRWAPTARSALHA